MRSINTAVLALLLVGPAAAQVLSPMDIKEPGPRSMQQKYILQLRALGSQIQKHDFPYPFYLSRALDIDQVNQARTSQNSIRFQKYNSEMVLAITGNYYASYSAELMDGNQLPKKTLDDVVLPILKAAVPPFADDDSFGAFAFELSHHVRTKVMGIAVESPENVMFLLPRAAAQHMATATSPEQIQVALLESQVFLNSEPVVLWYTGPRPPEEPSLPSVEANAHLPSAKNPQPLLEVDADAAPTTTAPLVNPKLLKPFELPTRIITPKTLADLKSAHAGSISALAIDLSDQGHLVSYAPPDFIAFHEHAYLQLSLTTTLDDMRPASRYKLAALAFDDHISHLVRPVLAYFQDATDFDGVVFSTTVKQAGGSASQAVEFFFPFAPMRCFARYDCTGQQLIDSSVVLLNGERIGLDLQQVEAVTTK